MPKSPETTPLARYNCGIDVRALARDVDALELILPLCEAYLYAERHPFYQYEPDSSPDRDQLAIHSSTAGVRICFGGNQSGKSRCAAQEVAWVACGRHPYQKTPPHAKIWCISTTYRTLQEGIWRHLEAILPRWEVRRYGARVSGFEMRNSITLRNGAVIDFISGDGNDDARRKVQSAAVDLIVIDEEINSAMWQELQMRRLARGGRVLVSCTAFLSEPWLLDLEDRATEGDPTVFIRHFNTERAVVAGHLDKATFDEIQTSFDGEDRDIRLKGLTRRESGLVYPEFTRRNLIHPQDVPADATRYCAIDPGFRTFAVLWAAVTKDKEILVYRELYEHARRVDEMADKIKAAEGWDRVAHWEDPDGNGHSVWQIDEKKSERIALRVIDPAAFSHEVSGSLGVGFLLNRDHGLSCVPSMHDVEVGIEEVKRLLMPDMAGNPRLKVFSNLRNLLKEMRSYRRRPKRERMDEPRRSDAPMKKHDHLLDCLRYMALSGLHYVPPSDLRLEAFKASNASYGGQVLTWQEEQIQRMAETRNARQEVVHVGGLGSEF